MRRSLKGICLCLLAAPAVVCAQTAVAADPTETIRALLSRIELLEKRVAELETRSNPTAPAVLEPAAPAPEPPPPMQAGAAPHMHAEHPGTPQMTSPSPHLEGFGDFNFAATDKPGSHSGFNEGQFVLHFNSALSSKVTYLGELSLTARTDAGLGSPPATGFNAEVERAII